MHTGSTKTNSKTLTLHETQNTQRTKLKPQLNYVVCATSTNSTTPEQPELLIVKNWSGFQFPISYIPIWWLLGWQCLHQILWFCHFSRIDRAEGTLNASRLQSQGPQGRRPHSKNWILISELYRFLSSW